MRQNRLEVEVLEDRAAPSGINVADVNAGLQQFNQYTQALVASVPPAAQGIAAAQAAAFENFTKQLSQQLTQVEAALVPNQSTVLADLIFLDVEEFILPQVQTLASDVMSVPAEAAMLAPAVATFEANLVVENAQLAAAFV